MECWFTERGDSFGLTCRVKAVLHRERSRYQEIVVYDTEAFGRLLTLDDVVMTSERDEFVYHEMLAHVPLVTHPRPRRVLVIGGGDGGVVREVLKHRAVEEVHLVEIDGRVLAAAREHLPTIASGLGDPRVRVTVGDGIEYVQGVRDAYDVIIVDSTDPVGPAVGLFREEFYRDVAAALAADGLFAAQTESPFFDAPLLKEVHLALRAIFPVTRLALFTVPTYPGGLWSLSLGSKAHDPLTAPLDRARGLATRYYSPEIHRAAFVLPPFVQEILR